MSPSVVLLQLLTVYMGLAASTAATCPTEGCPQSATTVCGSDGLTYMNECLAACQGVTVAFSGSCTPTSQGANQGGTAAKVSVYIPTGVFTQAIHGDHAATSATSTLSPAVIRAHQAEGLRMVGVVKRSGFEPIMPVLARNTLSKRDKNMPGTTLMINSHGHLYAAPPGSKLYGPAVMLQAQTLPRHPTRGSISPTEALGAVRANTTGINPSTASAVSQSSIEAGGAAGGVLDAPPAAVRNRRLQSIFGSDTRHELPELHYPLSAAGRITFIHAETKKPLQCSGTLVGTYAVLTTAHCIVARNGEVQHGIKFTAAETSRNRQGMGVGRGMRVYFNSEYLSAGDDWPQWDLGIVILDTPLGVANEGAFEHELRQLMASTSAQPRPHHPPRHTMESEGHEPWPRAGTLGYAAEPTLNNTQLMSAGYPGDKPAGSVWYMRCNLTEASDSAIIPNKCPIVNGQSGASLVEARDTSNSGEPHFYVRGIISFELCESVCGSTCCMGEAADNGALKITPFFQSFIDTHRNTRP